MSTNKACVASRHTNWTEYLADPEYAKENDELFISSLKLYLFRGGTIKRAAELAGQLDR